MNEILTVRLWGEELSYNKNEFIMYKINQELESRIKINIEKFNENQREGKSYTQQYDVESGATDFSVMPWALENVKYINTIISETGNYVQNILDRYSSNIYPDWNIINEEWFDVQKTLHTIYSCAHRKYYESAVSELQISYDNVYNDVLESSKGLDFGIISNSLTAHLIYAVQTVEKEEAAKRKALSAASAIMGNDPIAVISRKWFEKLYPFYEETFKGMMIDFLVKYYSSILELLSEELCVNFEEMQRKYNKELSDKCINKAQVAKKDILDALKIYPDNYDILSYALLAGIGDVELFSYIQEKEEDIREKIKECIKINLKNKYIKDRKFNKPIINDNTKLSIQTIIEFYSFLKNTELSQCEEWEEIILEVYEEESRKAMEEQRDILGYTNINTLKNLYKEHTYGILLYKINSEICVESLEHYILFYNELKFPSLIKNIQNPVSKINEEVVLLWKKDAIAKLEKIHSDNNILKEKVDEKLSEISRYEEELKELGMAFLGKKAERKKEIKKILLQLNKEIETLREELIIEE